MNVDCLIVMTVETVLRAAAALTFGLIFRTLTLNTRSMRGSTSALPMRLASAAALMLRPVFECVMRTRLSVMIARESRG